jgi:uncharacterized membrane protein
MSLRNKMLQLTCHYCFGTHITIIIIIIIIIIIVVLF